MHFDFFLFLESPKVKSPLLSPTENSAPEVANTPYQ